MRLLGSSGSPFAAKVRMAARQCGIDLAEQIAETQSEPNELLAANPLGKIPVLVLDDGRTLYDSRVICEYLDRLSGNRIVPQTDDEWAAAKRLEATADGVLDAAILVIYESRFRPEEKRHEPWVDRQWRKAVRGLAVLEREIGDVPREPTIGHIAVAALLGWLDLRFAGQWETDHPALRRWQAAFSEKFPEIAALKSKI